MYLESDLGASTKEVIKLMRCLDVIASLEPC